MFIYIKLNGFQIYFSSPRVFSLDSSPIFPTSYLTISSWFERLIRISIIQYPSLSSWYLPPNLFFPNINGNLPFSSFKPCCHSCLLSFPYTPIFNPSANPVGSTFKYIENLTTCHSSTVITLVQSTTSCRLNYWKHLLTSLPASSLQIVLSVVAKAILLKHILLRSKPHFPIWNKHQRPDYELQGPVWSAPSTITSRSHLLLFPSLPQLQPHQPPSQDLSTCYLFFLTCLPLRYLLTQLHHYF